eukprot:TRINITY_DN31416_c0_g1_i1.p1 TRINITY_DN31416_c0_g1~~TRINITY_DN31416_c0_g1_i1.p1  ORF type:complete len:1061 (+),score=55.32 TRINITY_DN31416_c0_g1_i1:125-3307(+)
MAKDPMRFTVTPASRVHHTSSPTWLLHSQPQPVPEAAVPGPLLYTVVGLGIGMLVVLGAAGLAVLCRRYYIIRTAPHGHVADSGLRRHTSTASLRALPQSTPETMPDMYPQALAVHHLQVLGGLAPSHFVAGALGAHGVSSAHSQGGSSAAHTASCDGSGTSATRSSAPGCGGSPGAVPAVGAVMTPLNLRQAGAPAAGAPGSPLAFARARADERSQGRIPPLLAGALASHGASSGGSFNQRGPRGQGPSTPARRGDTFFPPHDTPSSRGRSGDALRSALSYRSSAADTRSSARSDGRCATPQGGAGSGESDHGSTQSSETDCATAGQRTAVCTRNGVWRTGIIVDREGTKVRIRYDGFGSGHEEWIDTTTQPQRIPALTLPVAGGSPALPAVPSTPRTPGGASPTAAAVASLPSPAESAAGNTPLPPSPTARYQVLSQLGHGSFGTVYKVRRRTDGAVFALKHIRTQDPRGRDLALRELQLLQHVPRHPNVVHLVDTLVKWAGGGGPGEGFAERDGYVCLVMPFYADGDLRQLCRSEWGDKPQWNVPERRLMEIARQIALALRHLHSRQPRIIHRDLKPENVLVCDRGRRLVVADFGLARETHADYLNTRAGTLAYAAPEVFQRHYGCEVDLWSLGCILHAVAIGWLLGTTDTPMLLMRSQKPGFSAEIRAELQEHGQSQFLAELTAKLLQPKPSERLCADGVLLEIKKEASRAEREMPHQVPASLLNVRPSTPEVPQTGVSLLPGPATVPSQVREPFTTQRLAAVAAAAAAAAPTPVALPSHSPPPPPAGALDGAARSSFGHARSPAAALRPAPAPVAMQPPPPLVMPRSATESMAEPLSPPPRISQDSGPTGGASREPSQPDQSMLLSPETVSAQSQAISPAMALPLAHPHPLPTGSPAGTGAQAHPRRAFRAAPQDTLAGSSEDCGRSWTAPTIRVGKDALAQSGSQQSPGAVSSCSASAPMSPVASLPARRFGSAGSLRRGSSGRHEPPRAPASSLNFALPPSTLVLNAGTPRSGSGDVLPAPPPDAPPGEAPPPADGGKGAAGGDKGAAGGEEG